MKRLHGVGLLVIGFLAVTSTGFAQDITTVDGLREVMEGSWSILSYSALQESHGVPWVANKTAGPGPGQIQFNPNGAAIFDQGPARLWSVQIVGSVWARPSVRLTGESEVAYLVPLWVNAGRTEMDALLVTSDAPIGGYAEYLKLRKR